MIVSEARVETENSSDIIKWTALANIIKFINQIQHKYKTRKIKKWRTVCNSKARAPKIF